MPLQALPLLLPNAEIPPAIWPYILCSTLAETSYYLALMRAYANADFSLTYPIARGVAPALIAVWSIIFIGERPQFIGVIGIAIILLGLGVISAGHLTLKRNGAPIQFRSVLLALFIARLISVYSVSVTSALSAKSASCSPRWPVGAGSAKRSENFARSARF